MELRVIPVLESLLGRRVFDDAGRTACCRVTRELRQEFRFGVREGLSGEPPLGRAYGAVTKRRGVGGVLGRVGRPKTYLRSSNVDNGAGILRH